MPESNHSEECLTVAAALRQGADAGVARRRNTRPLKKISRRLGGKSGEPRGERARARVPLTIGSRQESQCFGSAHVFHNLTRQVPPAPRVVKTGRRPLVMDVWASKSRAMGFTDVASDPTYRPTHEIAFLKAASNGAENPFAGREP
jgi:hypothetical protein